MAFWLSVEVLDGSFAASLWAEAWRDSVVEAAADHGALHWGWHRLPAGVVFEVRFADEPAGARFCSAEVVRAALEAAPDPTAALVYRGRRGATAAARRPRPARVDHGVVYEGPRGLPRDLGRRRQRLS